MVFLLIYDEEWDFFVAFLLLLLWKLRCQERHST